MLNTTIAESLIEFFESGDPIIRKWTLVDSLYTPFLCSALYVAFVKSIGPALMQNRKPFDLRSVMIIYNFFIVAMYVGCLSYLIFLAFTTDAYRELCAPTLVTLYDYTYYASATGWLIYVLKYVEFADTIFFVLRRKNHLITNLHVIHHSLLPMIGFVLLRTETSGFQFLPSGLNCFVHIVMYTYYGLAAMGPEIQKYLWWKKYLTQLQILQFVIIIVFVLVIIPLSGCKTSKHGIYMDIIVAALFLTLFINFYFKTYKRKKTAVSNGVRKTENGHQYGQQANGMAKTSEENGGLKKRH